MADKTNTVSKEDALKRRSQMALLRSLLPIAGLIIVFIVFNALTKGRMLDKFSMAISSVYVTMIASTGVFFVMTMGGLDFSQGSILGMASIVVCMVSKTSIPLAIVGSVIIGIIMIVFCNRKSAQKPFIAVITCADGKAEEKAAAYLKENTEKATVKSKSAQKGCIEMTYEVTLRGGDTDFITKLSETEGVESAVLVSYNGDYMG